MSIKNRKVLWANNLDNGFDIVIGNPPYGANIDSQIDILKKIYPETSVGYKDIYKYFYNLGIKLLNEKGVLAYITPNTFLRQPRYGDLRRLLLKYRINQILDLGENVFETAVVPVSICIISKYRIEDNLISFIDLTKIINKNIFECLSLKKINQSDFHKIPNNIFIENIRHKQENEYTLDEILEMKDAGFKYQRKKVGLSQKGKNDLTDRIFYSGDLENNKDIPILVGKEIESYYYSNKPDKILRHNYKSLLKDNEITYYNKIIFQNSVKLIWRQTAPYFIGTVLNDTIFFGNTIQAGIIRDKFENKISYEYLCGLLNSKYLRYLYENNVKEEGRTFPQIKLEKLKPLPIIIAENCLAIENKVKEIIVLKSKNPKADTKTIEAQIDKLVYELYNLTEEEIAIIEKE